MVPPTRHSHRRRPAATSCARMQPGWLYSTLVSVAVKQACDSTAKRQGCRGECSSREHGSGVSYRFWPRAWVRASWGESNLVHCTSNEKCACERRRLRAQPAPQTSIGEMKTATCRGPPRPAESDLASHRGGQLVFQFNPAAAQWLQLAASSWRWLASCSCFDSQMHGGTKLRHAARRPLTSCQTGF